MNRSRVALICVVVLGGAVFAQAQGQTQTPPPAGQKPPATVAPPLLPTAPKPTPPPFPADAKIAFVTFQAIVQESKLGKCGQDQMKKFTDDKGKELLDKQKAAKTLSDQITSGQGVLSDAKLRQMQQDLDKLQRQFTMDQEQIKADQDALNQELLDAFRDKVLPVIEQIRVERKLWAVFTVPDSNMAAAEPGLDLSMEAVKKLDEKFPTCGGK